jgi:hypothetical protein
MGLDIAEHRARSIDEALAEGAALLIAIDGGTARVVRARFPAAAARTASLGELAGRPRDVPDPFRMQMGAWMTYARELDGMLQAALPRLVELMPAEDGGQGSAVRGQGAEDGGQGIEGEGLGSERGAATGRIGQLLQVAVQMPGVVDWAAARGRIEADLAVIAALPAAPSDLVAAYVGLLRAGLALLPATPSERQLITFQEATARLSGPIGQPDLNELSARLAGLSSA